MIRLLAAILVAVPLVLREGERAFGLRCSKCGYCPEYRGDPPGPCVVCGHLFRDHTG